MGLTPPALTVRLRHLEEKLGVHLAVRGARGVTMTDEGRRLLEEAAEILERIENLPERVASQSRSMRGNLKVVAPFSFGRAHVGPIVGSLHLHNPELTVLLTLADDPMSHAADNDVVIHVGLVKDSSWVAHILAPNDRMLCASPEFVRRLPEKLDHPSQLENYPCLCLKDIEHMMTRWRFIGGPAKGGFSGRKSFSVRVNGALVSNDGSVVTRWAMDSLGIILRSEWEVAPLIATGALVRLLPQWRLASAPVMALVPTRKGVSARARGFIEAARAAFAPPPWRQRVRSR